MKPEESAIAKDEQDHLKRLMIAHADLQMALSAITFLSEELGGVDKFLNRAFGFLGFPNRGLVCRQEQ